MRVNGESDGEVEAELPLDAWYSSLGVACMLIGVDDNGCSPTTPTRGDGLPVRKASIRFDCSVFLTLSLPERPGPGSLNLNSSCCC